MVRSFDGKIVELLAPAGTFDIFKEVIRANSDAVYFGGPNLNMRMIRKGFNLSRQEVSEAVRMAHDCGKKAYVTVNSLINPNELEEARDYLLYLGEAAKPDAIIVQDYAILSLIGELGLSLPVHSSVMMNVHNEDMILALQKLGVTRVVVSREMDLKTARLLQEKTGMELEYFVHGDMCSVHGGNCLYSSFLFGMSSNRGRCLKPCRWSYRVKQGGYIYPTEYPLAVKDMYMYEHIPELIEAGITSFKIEGRMRDKEFISMLINAYGDAIDRYIEDPLGFYRRKDAQMLYENRKRDFSTAYAFGVPGLNNINRRYEGTGKFYSTGKVFSTPTEEREMTMDRVVEIKRKLSENPHISGDIPRPQLCVRVNNMEQAKAAVSEGVDVVYLSGDVFSPDIPFSKDDLMELCESKGNTRMILGLPRMMTELHFEQYRQFFQQHCLPIDGLLVTNLGAAYRFERFGYPLIGDFSLNVYNDKAAEVYAKFGIQRLTASMELHLDPFAALAKQSDLVKEVVVHGSPTVMYLEHDLYENIHAYQPIGEEGNRYVDDQILVLLTDKGENPVYRDVYGRNHITLAKELCYLPFIGELNASGFTHMRIEGCTYTTDQLKTIIRAYQKTIEQPDLWELWMPEISPVYAGYTLGTLEFTAEGGNPSGELVASGRTGADS